MSGLQKIIIGISLIFLFGGMGLFALGKLKPKGAGLYVESTPGANVYVDGQLVGRTPYEGIFRAGEVLVKLVPEGLAGYETKVKLASGIKTVVRRLFGENEIYAAGEVISFEKTGESGAGVSVVSTPDAAEVTVDGVKRGFAPVKVTNLTEGEHQIVVSAQGYGERVFTVRAVAGYKLIVVVKLPGQAVVAATAPPTSAEKALILATPTGFLRVRAEANSTAAEVGQVKPGEEYPLVEIDTTNKWLKIRLTDGTEGWVAAEYASVVTN